MEIGGAYFKLLKEGKQMEEHVDLNNSTHDANITCGIRTLCKGIDQGE
jgi:hypothetical protein